MNEIWPLLTKEQRTAINTAMPPDAKYGEVFEQIAIEQRRSDAQAEAEWLERWWKVTPTGECSGTCKEMFAHIASLKGDGEGKNENTN